MKQEEKNFLLKDLCGRLPYGVNFNYGNYDGCDYKVEIISPVSINNSFPIEDCKPYLRPMSSMTEEEREIYDSMFIEIEGSRCALFPTALIDWLNAHHFDFRGLIPMGLALEAPEGMYK